MTKKPNEDDKKPKEKKKTPKIKIIEPTKAMNHEDLKSYNARKKRVAAYCRVSTDELEQQTSYETQITYYTKMISENPNWELVGIYADEGVSGTSTKYRPEFARLMEDSLDGKIDIIFTKSISRFARNTLDSIKWVRKLQERNIEVRFEKEGINTLEKGSEMRLTIFSSIAQEESESMSSNIRWAMDKRRRRGEFSLPYSRFLGYKKGEDGRPEIVEEEAEIVRKIFNLYMNGLSFGNIAKKLSEEGIKTPTGKSKWNQSTVRSILTNEKYKGEARLNKTYTLNVLNRKPMKNRGEVAEIYITNSHEAIISPDYFDLVQVEITNRAQHRGKSSAKDLFACKVNCGLCGSHYGHRVWNDKRNKHYDVWTCSKKYDKNNRNAICKSANVREEVLKQGFIDAFNQILEKRDDYISVYRDKIGKLQTAIEKEKYPKQIEDVKNKYLDIVGKLQNFSYTSGDYLAQREEKTLLIDEAENLKQRINNLLQEQVVKNGEIARLRDYISLLERCDTSITEFTREIWRGAIKEVTVLENDIVFHFWDSTLVTLHINDLIAHTTM